MNRRLQCSVVALAAAAGLCLSARAATATNLFGFTGTEIYPIDPQVSNLHVADLDGDGLNDLIVADNLRSKISLLYNLTGQTNRPDAAPAQKPEINDLPPGSRFRIDSLPTEERIAALAVADVNGDGRPDLVYFGDAKDLIVRYNLGTIGHYEISPMADVYTEFMFMDDESTAQIAPGGIFYGRTGGAMRPGYG